MFSQPGSGLPGDYLTNGQGARLAQLLSRQNLNNGTMPGGLAHALQQGMMGLMMGRDMEAATKLKADDAAASEALIRGMSPQPLPEGVQGPPQLGGIDGAIQALGGLKDNASAGRLAQALLLKRAEKEFTPETFGALYPALDANGNPVLLRPGSKGSLNPVSDYAPSPRLMADGMPAPMQNFAHRQALVKQYGEGSAEVNRFDNYVRAGQQVNLGDRVGIIDPANPSQLRAVLPRGVPPEKTPEIMGAQAQAAAAGRVTGEAGANAVLDLPKIEADTTYMLDLLEKVDKHPGLSGVVGMPSFSGALRVPGTDEADFRTLLGQIGGRQFLQAFQSLKGGGQITEAEGIKATQAIARMDTAQTEKEFRAAAKEFSGIVRQSREQARKKAGGSPAPGPAAASPEDLQRLSDDELMRRLGGGR